LAAHSLSWESFLQLHTDAAARFQLKAVVYGESFFTKQALVRWLIAHHQRYGDWAAAHPAGARTLHSQPADTVVAASRVAATAHR
jgi:hypothetical protein